MLNRADLLSLVLAASLVTGGPALSLASVGCDCELSGSGGDAGRLQRRHVCEWVVR